MEFTRAEKAKEKIWMHPILAALLFMLEKNHDFREIVKEHPIKNTFIHTGPDPQWDDDLSYLLPEADRWWEGLGALHFSLSLLFLKFCFFDRE